MAGEDMVIRKLEIESFGKFKDYQVEFKEGINTIFGENEMGKSTICAFILAMFYDFTEKGKGIRDDLRTRYLPWSGEPMSGAVYFSHNKKNYILKRRMAKTVRGAKVTLLDGDTWEEISDERKESPGEFFFGVPYDSFFKTIYISQLAVPFERGKKDELFERLSNINQSGDEDISYRKTLTTLEKQKTELISVSGTGGRIVRLKAETEELKRKLFKAEEFENEYKSAALSATEAEKNKESLILKREALKKEKALAEKHEKFLLAKADFERFKQLTEEKERKEKELSESYERLSAVRQKNEKMSLLEGVSRESVELLESLSERKVILEHRLLEISEKRERIETELSSLEKANKPAFVPVLTGAACLVFVLSAVLSLFASAAYGILAVFGIALLILSFKLRKNKAAFEKNFEEIEKLKTELEEESEIIKEEEEIKKKIEDILERTESVSLVDLMNKLADKNAAAERIKSCEIEYKLIKESLELILPEFYKLSQTVDLYEADKEDDNYSGANSEEIDKKLSSLNEELLVCEKKLAEAKTNMRIIAEADRLTYSEIANQISTNEEQIEELLKVYKATEVALQLIKESYEELKSGFAPELIKHVKEAVLFLTDGKYSDVRISDDYKLTVMENDEIVSAEYLSGGTYDVLYLSLRFGLLKVLFEGKIPFLMLDDAFLQLDSNRVKKAAAYIKKENPEQVIYFTCRSELKDIFEGELS